MLTLLLLSVVPGLNKAEMMGSNAFLMRDRPKTYGYLYEVAEEWSNGLDCPVLYRGGDSS
ncbi:MAG: hypothetical protein ACAF41_04385 [Leptolyngbya sp. BL-A-14]